METLIKKFQENNVPWDTNAMAEIKRGSLVLVCRPSISFASLASLPLLLIIHSERQHFLPEVKLTCMSTDMSLTPVPLALPLFLPSGRRAHEGLNCRGAGPAGAQGRGGRSEGA